MISKKQSFDFEKNYNVQYLKQCEVNYKFTLQKMVYMVYITIDLKLSASKVRLGSKLQCSPIVFISKDGLQSKRKKSIRDSTK